MADLFGVEDVVGAEEVFLGSGAVSKLVGSGNTFIRNEDHT